MTLAGKDLIALGYKSGPWFGAALKEINAACKGGALSTAEIHAICTAHIPPPQRPLHKAPTPFHVNIHPENDDERENTDIVLKGFEQLMQTPTVVGGALMPDASQAGPMGSIPVGAVVVARNAIHPGFHSSDICCSMFLTEAAGADPKDLLDAVQEVTHFGPGGRTDASITVPEELIAQFARNAFLKDPCILEVARSHWMTQGDGNHFASVCLRGASGSATLVTHHGSRGVGARLYKAGMKVAEKLRRFISPATLPCNAWIAADSAEGEAYWAALQLLRDWTKANHRAIHDAALARLGVKPTDRFWNEHNAVFRDGDLFYHGKGATPVDRKFLPDTDGRQIIPFNMAQPILIVSGETTSTNLGFAPHGAGRNMSRTQHKGKQLASGRTEEDIFHEETRKIDARFFSGIIDISELPSAYKDAASVQRDMERFGWRAL